MLRKLRRWATLAPVDRTAATEAWVMLPVARWSLTLLGLARCQRLLASLPWWRSRPESAELAVARLQRAVTRASANQPWRVPCLERAVVLRSMLLRRGHDATLRIGVRRPGGGLEAHAWVECGGIAIADRELERGGYSALLPAVGGR